MAKKTAFVTGGTGFLGQVLIEELVEQHWQVTALHRASSTLGILENMPVDLVEGDIENLASLERAMSEGLDAVFHVAASKNMWSRRNDQQDRVNIDGTRHMVEAALRCGVKRFIHTSSVAVYGLQQGRITEETEQLGGQSWINYQRSKFFAEEEVRKGLARGLDPVILNPTSILGPHETSGLANLIRMVYHKKLPGVPSGAYAFGDVGEVARAHLVAFEHGRTGENYLLGGVDATYLELIQIIGEVTQRHVPDKPTPTWILRLLGRIGQWKSYLTGKKPGLTPETVVTATRRLSCDCTKAQRELGYQVVDLHTMVARCYHGLKQENLL